MATQILVPRLGWTMEEGIFGEWLVQNGASVNVGDLLYTIENDKATQEVESLASGVLHLAPNGPQPGDVVQVGTLLGLLAEVGESVDFEPSFPLDHSVVAPFRSRGSPVSVRVGTGEKRHAASPRARRIARELAVALSSIQGSGNSGRIVERDVRAAAAQVAEPASIPPDIPWQTGAEAETLPTSRVRRLIAQRLADSAHTTAAVTLTTEADATELVALREQLKVGFGRRGLPVPTYTDLLIKLTAIALEEHRSLNATWNGSEILLHREIHIGLAVDVATGLRVPVVRNANLKGLRQIAGETRNLIERAQTQRLDPDEQLGGTFTITNLGMYGIDAFTPIINLPQSAILGVGRIIAKPAVVGDQIVPRQMVVLSLTFDHRSVDGAPAARCLNTIREIDRRTGNVARWLKREGWPRNRSWQARDLPGVPIKSPLTRH